MSKRKRDICHYCAGERDTDSDWACADCRKAREDGHELTPYQLLGRWRRVEGDVFAVKTELRLTEVGLMNAIPLLPFWLRRRYKAYALAGEERREDGRWMLIRAMKRGEE